MNSKALHNISYGLFIITSKKGDLFNGQIANSVFQISNEPPTIAISINKKNLTSEYIHDSKLFAVSVISQEAPLSLIGHFGFKSGREVNKFADISYQIGQSGIPYIADNTVSYIEARVINEFDAGTHTIFLGEIINADVIKGVTPMTYAYYQQVKKGEIPKAASTTPHKSENKISQQQGEKYECTPCGYIYDPAVGDPDNDIPPGTLFESLPDDWQCPICGASKDAFEKVN